MADERRRLTSLGARLAPALTRTRDEAARRNQRDQEALAALTARLERAPQARLADLQKGLERLDRLRQTLGYTETLRRGYAVVRGGDTLVTTLAEANRHAALEIEFQDGRLAVAPTDPDGAPEGGPSGAAPKRPARKSRDDTPPPGQGSLF